MRAQWLADRVNTEQARAAAGMHACLCVCMLVHAHGVTTVVCTSPHILMFAY